MILQQACRAQIEDICSLVNLAYRGEAGWTQEHELVAGMRVTEQALHILFDDPNRHLLVAEQQGYVLSCICIEHIEDEAHIGLFAVHPRLQGCGVGKIILSQAESYAAEVLQVSKYILSVLTPRVELISYYERRGYRRTGKLVKYPAHLNVGQPLQPYLTVLSLVKAV